MARSSAYGCSRQGLTRFAVPRQSLPLLARAIGRWAVPISSLAEMFLVNAGFCSMALVEHSSWSTDRTCPTRCEGGIAHDGSGVAGVYFSEADA